MQERGERILLPHNPAPHLTDWLFEIGPSVGGAMGEAPLGWQDMAAWERINGIELAPWEAKTIRRLSIAWINERHEARKPDRTAPYTGTKADIVAKRDNIAAGLKAAFGGLKRATNEPKQASHDDRALSRPARSGRPRRKR